MPLAQMIHFAQLHHQGAATATQRLLLLEQHQQALQEQMQKLAQHATALQRKIDHKKASLASHASNPNEAEAEHADETSQSTGTQEEIRSVLMQKNEGRVALVTGASSGIGEATAWAFAMHGMRVAVAARRIDRLAALVERIQQAGGEAIALEADVTDEQQVQILVQHTQQQWGRLDILVNSAGLMLLGPIAAADTED
jgi:hypothetical protein